MTENVLFNADWRTSGILHAKEKKVKNDIKQNVLKGKTIVTTSEILEALRSLLGNQKLEISDINTEKLKII